MIVPLCSVGDAVLLAAGAIVLWRTPWQGRVRELALAIVTVLAATVVLAAAARAYGGTFAMLRGACHGLFCAGLPLLAVRAVRIRREAPLLAALLVATVVAGEACYVWARHVEPFRLEVTEARVTSPRLAALAAPLRVALVADLQCEEIGEYEVAVFDRLVAAKPDLVLWLGDYIQWNDGGLEPERTALQGQLARLSPRLGMFAVDGDVDGRCEAVFAGTNVRVLRDQHVELPDVPIDLLGLSRTKARAPFLDAGAVPRLRGDRFPIVFGHAPDFMLAVLRGGLQADALMCAGHTHGGQVQVPFFGPIVTLSSVPRWLAGGGVFRRGPTWLVCSRGIGMERENAPRIRFWCRPQLLLLDLVADGA